MGDSKIMKQGMAGLLIFGIFVIAFLILKPIVISILFGLLFGYILSPVYKKIQKHLKWKSLSALIVIIGLTAIIVIPLIYIVPSLVKQLFDTYVLLQNFNFNSLLQEFIQGDVATSLAMNLDNIIGKIFSTVLNQFTIFLVNLPSFLLQFSVFLFVFYFTIRDLDKLKEYLSNLSPFSKPTGGKFMEEFKGITHALIFGQILIGIIQGLAVGICLFFLGVPKALVLTFIACIVSIIPVLGSWLVWLPVGIFLIVTGNTFSGFFILLYGFFFVSIIDNILRPYFLSRGSGLPIALSVIGTIGGLYFFGIAGLILGPLILAYVLIIIEFYKEGKLNELFNK
ncbi:AI-2E family transporter [Candidatus Pacearchaeota archaeon]|nr:AI-2E family transporter [Candidatus Pacearchaeota archaeon]